MHILQMLVLSVWPGVAKESLVEHAMEIFSQEGEANIVRAAAASLLTAIAARTSPHTQVSERFKAMCLSSVSKTPVFSR